LAAVSDDVDRPILIHVVQHTVYPYRRVDQWPSEDRRTRLVVICRDKSGAAPVALALIAVAFVIAVVAAVLAVSSHLSGHQHAGHQDCMPFDGAKDSVCAPRHAFPLRKQLLTNTHKEAML
jgi:hypothetical protein